MDQIYCTLFDSNYIDKGLVLYESMCRCLNEFKLYVFAFDQKCEEILRNEDKENLIVISLQEFETEEMLRIKQERTMAEYCWTCSPLTIQYVLNTYHEPICTYIDADMMFFSSPQRVFDEMKSKGCSVLIVPHRYATREEEKRAYDTVGAYCVEFNTFINNDNGRRVLKWWSDRCLEWCYYSVPGTTEWYGDQKYLNKFEELFDGVFVCTHYGVGIAPWNVKLVLPEDVSVYPPTIKVLSSGEVFPIVIYHFESVAFLTKHILNVSSHMNSRELHKVTYDVYVEKIVAARKYIKQKYNFDIPKTRRVVTKNPIMHLYQKYLGPIRRIKRIKDLYWINEE